MTTPISNNSPPSFAPAASSTGNGSAAAAAASAGTPGANRKVDDQVKLTDSALALQEAARPDDGTVVDRQRVEQIRAAIADGSYSINPARISEKMFALEQQMTGAGKA